MKKHKKLKLEMNNFSRYPCMDLLEQKLWFKMLRIILERFGIMLASLE